MKIQYLKNRYDHPTGDADPHQEILNTITTTRKSPTRLLPGRISLVSCSSSDSNSGNDNNSDNNNNNITSTEEGGHNTRRRRKYSKKDMIREGIIQGLLMHLSVNSSWAGSQTTYLTDNMERKNPLYQGSVRNETQI
ncbi:myb-like protein B [Homarus americanus]|uniref:myb-like protein B n=1 Tax=Homarus americanus TaxID=6706 RepID=UPI001C442DA8|nr:myb-like protein B [Homarus americanus]